MPLIFVSHAAADRDIAKRFQEDVKSDFLGMCEVFVSSNLDSLNAGYEWNTVIKDKLASCSLLVGLLSPIALQRPWVYVEFGAGWIRNIPTIPLCHSGIDRGELPAPISSLQGLNLCEQDHLEHLYSVISSTVGCRKPIISYQNRAEEYLRITESLRLKRLILDWMHQLYQWNPDLENQLRQNGESEEILVPANLDQPFMEFAKEARARDFLRIDRAGMAMGTRVGPQASVFKVTGGPKIGDLIAHLKP